MDFLLYEPVNSLEEYYSQKNIERGNPEYPGNIEEKHLYLYQVPNEAGENINSIFQPDDENPLIVLTQIEFEDKKAIKDLVKGDNSIRREVFYTFGINTIVIVFRGNSYEKIVDLIVDNSGNWRSSYSIAGVDRKMPVKIVPPYDKQALLYQNLDKGEKQVNDSKVTVKYILKNCENSDNRVKRTIEEIKTLFIKFKNQFGLDEFDIKIKLFIELGRYDLELRIYGNIAYILEWLLNPDFGLCQVGSDFYSNHILESSTIWHVYQKIGEDKTDD